MAYKKCENVRTLQQFVYCNDVFKSPTAVIILNGNFRAVHEISVTKTYIFWFAL